MRKHRFACLAATLVAAGCASTPPPPYRVEEVAVALGAACIPAGKSDADATTSREVIPRGIVLVNSTEPVRPSKRSEARTAKPNAAGSGTETLLVAGESCAFALNPATAAVTLLKSGGNAFRPTAVSAVAGFVALLDAQQGAVRWLDTRTGEPAQTLVGLGQPIGVTLLPGGTALVTEYASGRVLRLRPTEDSRPLVLLAGLAGPVAVAGADTMTAYVTERDGGRIVKFGLRDSTRRIIAEGLDQPEGMVMLPHGRLAVIEAGQGRIVGVDPATRRTEILATGLRPASASRAAGATPGAEPMPTVMSITTAGDESLYVADPAAGKIFRLVPRSTH